MKLCHKTLVTDLEPLQLFAKRQSHDETRFQHFLLKPGVTETKPLSFVFVVEKRMDAYFSNNATLRNEMSRLVYMCQNCGINKVKKHSKHR